MTLPAHIIDRLNASEEHEQRAVLDAAITARLDERARFKEERGQMAAAVKVLELLDYNPHLDLYYLSSLDVAQHNLSRWITPVTERTPRP